MMIETGLFDRMVLQRDDRSKSDASFSGTSDADGTLYARVTQRGKVVSGFARARAGKASRGKLTGALKGLPAGGPYDIELTIERRDGKPQDRLKVRDVLVGDVWIAAGQSNMQGCGLRPAAAKPHPMARAFYMDDRWDTACDPIHNMWDCVDQVHIDIAGGRQAVNNVAGVGPAVAFAQEMHRLTGVPQGVLACAHGGTSMEQWEPAKKSLGGGSLYGATLRRVQKNGGRAAGIVWYQGESDALGNAAPHYTERMKTLVRSFRRDLRDARLPFVAVQLGRFCSIGFDAAPWNSVQEQQRKLQESVPSFATVPAVDLALDDGIHIGGADQQRLGRRLANAMSSIVGGRKAGKPPITLRGVKVQTGVLAGTLDIVVEFDNVEGRLRAGDRPTGFTIVDHRPGPFIYDTVLDGDRVILRTSIPLQALGDKSLHYGYGTDTFCNITDEADRSLPVFGPVPIAELRALTPFVQSFDVAFPVKGAANDLGDLEYPADVDALPWRPMRFAQRMADLHGEWAALDDKSFTVFYRCTLRCPEPMKLAACLGYDGPVKLWIDGREVYHDPAGNNPAMEDQAKVKLKLDAGEHEVLVALSSNHGRAWGIFLRFERPDVPAELLRKGRDHYALPEVEAPGVAI